MVSVKAKEQILPHEHEKDRFPSLSFDDMLSASDWTFSEINLGHTNLSKLGSEETDLNNSGWNSLNTFFQENDLATSQGIKQELKSKCETFTVSDSDEMKMADAVTEFGNEVFNPDAFMTPAELKTASCIPMDTFSSTNSCSKSMLDYSQITFDGNSNSYIQLDSKIRDVKEYTVYEKFIPIKPKINSPGSPNQIVSSQYDSNHPSFEKQLCTDLDLKPNAVVSDQVDIKQRVLKRQQRMVRNRESALHSRKKKKEMMHTLEDRVNSLSNLNVQLKTENDLLKDKIKGLEFENWKLKNQKLIDVSGIAKKTSCALVIFVFLAINSRSIGMLSSTKLSSKDAYESSGRHGRFLLEFKRKSNDDPYSTHQNTAAYNQQHPRYDSEQTVSNMRNARQTRKLLIPQKINSDKHYMLKNNLKGIVTNGTNGAFDDADCSSSFNKTEAVRLNEALERLVKVHRMAQPKKQRTDLIQKNAHRLHGLRRHRKPLNCSSYLDDSRNCSTKERKNTTENVPKAHYDKSLKRRELIKWNELQLFQRDWSALKLLKKSIDRKPNTFYFMSFKKDHIILPATQVNETKRPRFSFILPLSIHSNWNDTRGQISMVQIDCQVMDTKVLHISGQNIVSN